MTYRRKAAVQQRYDDTAVDLARAIHAGRPTTITRRS